jgi:hypothetical protein
MVVALLALRHRRLVAPRRRRVGAEAALLPADLDGDGRSRLEQARRKIAQKTPLQLSSQFISVKGEFANEYGCPITALTV